MKPIKISLLFTALFLYSFVGFGQTFTYVGSFDLTEETNDADELCMTIYDGKIFVQDEGDDEIDIYSATNPYGFISDFGGAQFGNSEDGIVVYNGLIFVADDSDDDIEVFKASDYSFVTQINTSAELSDIEGFTIAFGKIFVVDSDNAEVVVFSATSPYSYLTRFGSAQLNEPAGITHYGNNVIVVDEINDNINVFNGNNYSYIGSFDTGGDDQYGEGIAVICDYILVLDSDSDGRVDVFDAISPFNYITTFGQGQIGNVECIAVSGNLIYIVDADPDQGDHEIDIFRLEEGCAPIPTLSQWSLIALSIFMLIFGVAVVRQRKLIIG